MLHTISRKHVVQSGNLAKHFEIELAPALLSAAVKSFHCEIDANFNIHIIFSVSLYHRLINISPPSVFLYTFFMYFRPGCIFNSLSAEALDSVTVNSIIAFFTSSTRDENNYHNYFNSSQALFNLTASIVRK